MIVDYIIGKHNRKNYMKAYILPLQSLYKSTQICIEEPELKKEVVVDIKTNDEDKPSPRELQKWGYKSYQEALQDDMLDDIRHSEGYEREIDYLFAESIVSKINGET